MFKKINTFKSRHKVIFALLIGAAVVSFWRGVWGLMDVYLFPDNYELSSWTSFLAGVTVLGVTHYIVDELM